MACFLGTIAQAASGEAMTRSRFFPPFVLLTIISGCPMCDSGQGEVASAEGPPPVQWIHDRPWESPSSGGRGSLPIPQRRDRPHLRIGTRPPQQVAIDCHEPNPELVVEPTGRRIAYRCDMSENWRLVHVVTPPLVDPEPGLGGAPEPPWQQAPDFETSAIRVIAQSRLPEEVASRFDQIKTLGGDEALARALVSTAGDVAGDEGRLGDRSDPPPWDQSFAGLPQAHQETARAALRQQLAQPEVGWRLLRRATIVFPPEDDGVNSMLIDHARRIPHVGHWAFKRVMLRGIIERVRRTRPRDAASLACRTVDATGRPGETEDLLLIAAAQEPCPILSRRMTCPTLLQGRGCAEPSAPWRACSADELTQRIAQDLDQLVRTGALGPSSLRAEDYLLAIARSRQEVPRGFERASVFRAYTVEQPAQPPCYHNTEPGQPCACWILEEDAPSSLLRTL